MNRTPFAALFAFLPLAACAGYTITPVAPPKDATETTETTWATSSGPGEGYLIYEPEPYLQVVFTRADGGKLTAAASVVYLPNRQRAYRVNTYAFLATADIKLAYRDGWMLTNADSSVDTGGLAKAVIEAVGDLQPLAADRGPAGAVRWFRFDFDANGRVSGLSPVANVPLGLGR